MGKITTLTKPNSFVYDKFTAVCTRCKCVYESITFEDLDTGDFICPVCNKRNFVMSKRDYKTAKEEYDAIDHKHVLIWSFMMESILDYVKRCSMEDEYSVDDLLIDCIELTLPTENPKENLVIPVELCKAYSSSMSGKSCRDITHAIQNDEIERIEFLSPIDTSTLDDILYYANIGDWKKENFIHEDIPKEA